MDALARIKEYVDGNPVILFMKGSPQMPMCGFSSRTSEALKSCGRAFAYVDVISDPEIRATLPSFSEWPTFPQLFINGELVGGCDIVMDLHESGQLEQLVQSAADAAKGDDSAA